MKKSIFILAMLLLAAAAFTQTSRRSANSKTPAREESKKSTAVKQEKKEATTTTRRISQSNSNTTSAKTESASRATATPTQSRQQEKSSQSVVTSRRGTTSTQYNSSNKNSDNKNVNNNQSVHQNRSANHSVRTAPGNTKIGTTYVTYYESPRVYRDTRVVKYHYTTTPRDRYYRARHYPYRTPLHLEIFWTPSMRLEYTNYYPMVNHWRYTNGYRIQSVSAYDALRYQGEVMNVYGKVYETFYTGKTDEYILYFGAYYPYHDFSVVLPGWVARRLSRWPEEYFERQDVVVTGLITGFEEKPEIVVRNTGQIRIY